MTRERQATAGKDKANVHRPSSPFPGELRASRPYSWVGCNFRLSQPGFSHHPLHRNRLINPGTHDPVRFPCFSFNSIWVLFSPTGHKQVALEYSGRCQITVRDSVQRTEPAPAYARQTEGPASSVEYLKPRVKEEPLPRVQLPEPAEACWAQTSGFTSRHT